MTREEIIYTTSEDGFLLEGIDIHPDEAAAQPVGIIWVHGNASRFYDYPYIMIGRALAAQGYPFVSVNTRGHDISAYMWRSAAGKPLPWSTPRDFPIGAGAGWERLADAPLDLAAWVERATQIGTPNVVLVGHSSGAQRIALYQAERQDARVKGLIFASPDLRSFIIPNEVQEAERLIGDGKGIEVVAAQPFAPWYRQSAENVVSRAKLVPQILNGQDGAPPIFAKIQQPCLAFYGTQERDSDSLLAAMRQAANPAMHLTTHVIDQADHMYHDHETEVAAAIAQWVNTLA
jgi:pimeloyl-ACP methyl ester carboxylesterase